MSKNHGLPVHVFNGVFFAGDQSFTVLDESGKEVLPVSVQEGSDLSWGMRRSGVGKMFDVPYESVTIVRIREEREVVEYAPVDTSGRLKNLDVEAYESLSDSFKAKYKKVLTPPTVVQDLVPVNEFFYGVDFNENVFLGKHTRNVAHQVVHSIRLRREFINGNRYADERSKKMIPGFGNFTDIDLDDASLFALISRAYHNLSVATPENPVQVLISIPQDARYGHEAFRMEFLETPYKGEVKKVLLQKKNGGFYADRRSTNRPDLPPVVGKASFPARSVMNWWMHVEGNALPDEEKLEVIDQFVSHLLAGAQ